MKETKRGKFALQHRYEKASRCDQCSRLGADLNQRAGWKPFMRRSALTHIRGLIQATARRGGATARSTSARSSTESSNCRFPLTPHAMYSRKSEGQGLRCPRVPNSSSRPRNYFGMTTSHPAIKPFARSSGSNLTFKSLLGFPRFAACASLRDARRKIHHRFVGRSASA